MDEYGALVEMVLRAANRSIWRKSCPSATLYNTNPSRTVLGTKPDLRGERQANSDAKPWYHLR